MRDRVLDTGSSADKNEVYKNRCMLETKDLILRKAEFDDWEPMYRNVWSKMEPRKRITKYLASFPTLFYTGKQI